MYYTNIKHVVFVLFLFVFFISFEIPLFAYRPASRAKHCQSNLRVLQGAVEMYNMDHEKMIDTVVPGRNYEEFEKVLINEKYLKNFLYRPEKDCSYGFIDASATGTYFCKRHGTQDLFCDDYDKKPVLPKYNTNLEYPFSYEYETKEERAEIDRKIKKNFIDTLLPTVLLIVVIFVGWNIISWIGKFFSKKEDNNT